jgi:hypothetical protein
VLTEISDIKFYNEVLFVRRRRNVFLFVTLIWNESYCLRYKEDKLQFTARNCIVLCVCVCRKLLSAAERWRWWLQGQQEVEEEEEM